MLCQPFERHFLHLVLLFGALSGLNHCSPNEGQGFLRSDRLFANECFVGPFEMQPNFFASNPFRNTQTIRIQRGNDLIENSDGVSILVDDTNAIRIQKAVALKVGLPPEITPPGTLMTPLSDPPKVHLTLYLHETCHARNIALYAIAGTVTFDEIFSGNPTERTAVEKLTSGRFDVTIADPRDAPPGGGDVPTERTSRLTGEFRFYFQRGQPGQPFP